MALSVGQVQVRDLVMGTGTNYRVLTQFNPFNIAVRSNQSGPRAWNHGSWSGVEWAQERVVPIRVAPVASDGTTGSWLTLHQALMAAFAPVGEVATDVECRFTFGGTEYVMFGRPRMVQSEVRTIQLGFSFAQAAFVALDPRIYSGTLHTTGAVDLPTQTGGLTVPFTVPFTVDGVVVGGSATLVNAGTTETGLFLRIDGPVSEPTVTLQRADGGLQALRLLFDIPSGQWVEIDTAARTVFANGLPQASRRGQVTGDFPLAAPGTNTLRLSAADIDTGTVTAQWRDAWW